MVSFPGSRACNRGVVGGGGKKVRYRARFTTVVFGARADEERMVCMRRPYHIIHNIDMLKTPDAQFQTHHLDILKGQVHRDGADMFEETAPSPS